MATIYTVLVEVFFDDDEDDKEPNLSFPIPVDFTSKEKALNFALANDIPHFYELANQNDLEPRIVWEIKKTAAGVGLVGTPWDVMAREHDKKFEQPTSKIQ